jgi:hypothetical protein
MKRFLVLLLVAVMAVPALFAVDVKASVVMGLDVWHGDNGFQLSNKDQRDDDLLSFTLAGEKAGAYFRLESKLVSESNGVTVLAGPGVDGVYGTADDVFETIDASDESAAAIRKAEVWFKPVDMLKITIGNVGGSLFTETINWWQVADGTLSGWSNDIIAAAEGGVSFELKPIDALTIKASLAPGYGTPLATAGELNKAAVKWGVVAKYAIDGVGTVGAGFRDDGDGSWKMARVGFQLTAVEGLSAFLQGTFRLDDSGLTGMAIDPFVDFTAGALNIKASLPLTIIPDNDATPMGLRYDVHVKYSMEKVSPYFSIEQNGDGIILGGTTDASFTPQINLGMTWGYDVGSLDLSFQLNVADPGADTTWQIPFEVRVTM